MKYWFILFLGLNSLKAQNPIQIENHWLYTNYYEAGQPLSTAQLWQRLESQSASAVASQHARRKLRTVYWLQGTATLVLGVQTARWASSGKPPQWEWSLPALGVLGYSIPLERKANKKVKQAIEAYHDSLKTNTPNPKNKFLNWP